MEEGNIYHLEGQCLWSISVDGDSGLLSPERSVIGGVIHPWKTCIDSSWWGNVAQSRQWGGKQVLYSSRHGGISVAQHLQLFGFRIEISWCHAPDYCHPVFVCACRWGWWSRQPPSNPSLAFCLENMPCEAVSPSPHLSSVTAGVILWLHRRQTFSAHLGMSHIVPCQLWWCLSACCRKPQLPLICQCISLPVPPHPQGREHCTTWERRKKKNFTTLQKEKA